MTAKEQGLPELPQTHAMGLYSAEQMHKFREEGITAALASDTGERGATPPESGGQGEAVAWTWRHPEGDSGNWWPNTPDNEAYKARVQQHGCVIEYAYTHPPAQASGAVTEELAKRIYYMRRDFDLSTVERTRLWARECRDIVEALTQGGGNER